MDMTLNIGTRVGQEVDKGSLLDELVLVVDTDILDLLLGGHEPLSLALLNSIGPLVGELLGLVARVHIVEVGEFGSDNEGEVTDLRHTQVEAEDELVMEDETSNPFVMRPAAHSGEGGDGADVQEEEDETAAGSAEGLVVGGDLLGADSLEQGLHVVVVREGDGGVSRVIGVLVTFTHRRKLVSIVTLAILLSIDGFSPNKKDSEVIICPRS